VQRRVEHLRRQRPFPNVTDHPAILVDDGLASGSTMRVAVESLRKHGPKPIIIAVPTGHSWAVTELAEEIDALYCSNIRSGVQFAVADAYENWYDEDEETIADILRDFAG
jgi:putative phosphoribosyl transferase